MDHASLLNPWVAEGIFPSMLPSFLPVFSGDGGNPMWASPDPMISAANPTKSNQRGDLGAIANVFNTPHHHATGGPYAHGPAGQSSRHGIAVQRYQPRQADATPAPAPTPRRAGPLINAGHTLDFNDFEGGGLSSRESEAPALSPTATVTPDLDGRRR
ncbi:hypothetical protein CAUPRSCDRAFT_13131, partial [Caulochytrium protostelioides]